VLAQDVPARDSKSTPRLRLRISYWIKDCVVVPISCDYAQRLSGEKA
jgi:hypothetical protein